MRLTPLLLVLAAAANGAWFGSQFVLAIKQDRKTSMVWRLLTWIGLIAPLGLIVALALIASS